MAIPREREYLFSYVLKHCTVLWICGWVGGKDLQKTFNVQNVVMEKIDIPREHRVI